jgi:hypothetical protein
MPDRARWSVRTALFAILSIALLISSSPPASAQLADAMWIENVSIQVDFDFGGEIGSDNSKPENLSSSRSGDDYVASGSVTYAQSAVPEVTCEASTNYQAGELTNLIVDTSASVIWRFVVVESASGGPSVSSVPIHVTAQGSASVTADAATLSAANARFSIRYEEGAVAVVYEDIVANNVGGTTPLSDTFAVDDQFPMPIDEVFVALIITGASSRASFDQGPAVGSATGFVDPIIEVADELIPGSSSNYRDYYTVEFSKGHDAGDPSTPLRSSPSMGELKSRYDD